MDNSKLISIENNIFGKNVRLFREKMNLSQKDLAEMCGYSTPLTIYKIETGRSDPAYSVMIKIANALGVHPVDLLRNHNDQADIACEDLIYQQYGEPLKKIFMLLKELSPIELAEVKGFIYHVLYSNKRGDRND